MCDLNDEYLLSNGWIKRGNYYGTWLKTIHGVDIELVYIASLDSWTLLFRGEQWPKRIKTYYKLECILETLGSESLPAS